MKHYAIIISGKVQGVGFRNHTVFEAVRLGMNGYIQNKSNGDVYIEVEGEEPALSEFLLWCLHGPAQAHVREMVIKEGKVKKFISFERK